jgi:hypothetical protein
VEREKSAARPPDMPLLPRVRRAPRGQRICIRDAWDLISSGNFQAKLKLDSFAEFEAHQKIGAALEMFMVSAGTDTGELFIASVIGIGTRLMRRAAKRGAIVTQGFPGTGGQRAFGSWGVFSLRRSGRASIRLLSGDRGSQVARAIRLAGIFWRTFDRYSDLPRVRARPVI